MLPWVLPTSDNPSPPFADCNKCKRMVDAGTRRAWHCGWMDKGEWSAVQELPPALKSDDPEIDVCPGWLCCQPAVQEAAHAYSARRDGVLETYYPDPPAALLEAVDICTQAFNRYENEQMTKRSQRG